jgi:hypothetical protein
MSILHCHFQEAKIKKIKLNWQIRKKTEYLAKRHSVFEVLIVKGCPHYLDLGTPV